MSCRAETYAYAIAKSASSYEKTYVHFTTIINGHQILAMPRRCIAAGYNTSSGMGYSLHSFPKDETLRRKWISAVKCQRSNWDGTIFDIIEMIQKELPQNEVKLLVFRSHLLSHLQHVDTCHQLCTGKVAQQMETFISTKQAYSHRGHVWMWNSQLFIKLKTSIICSYFV